MDYDPQRTMNVGADDYPPLNRANDNLPLHIQINAHGLRPTTNNESSDRAMLINSFQIKTF